MSDSPRALIAEFIALPGHETFVAELVSRHADVVRAEAGNVCFVPYRTIDDPARFLVYEVYRDEAAFSDHLGSIASGDFNAVLTQHITRPQSDLTLLESV